MMIVLEGIDGSGKSTHLDFLHACARRTAAEVVMTREPGGSPLAERLRTEILQTPMDSIAELLLVFAARRAHLEETVWPALARGAWVISDRYVDSSLAYQGAGRGLAEDQILGLTRLVEGDWQGPDLVVYFDCPSEVAAARRAQRARSDQGRPTSAPDRFDAEDTAFFERVREGYRRAAARRGPKALWIDGTQPIPEIQKILEERIFSQ
jgi:dTMP kinase